MDHFAFFPEHLLLNLFTLSLKPLLLSMATDNLAGIMSRTKRGSPYIVCLCPYQGKFLIYSYHSPKYRRSMRIMDILGYENLRCKHVHRHVVSKDKNQWSIHTRDL